MTQQSRKFMQLILMAGCILVCIVGFAQSVPAVPKESPFNLVINGRPIEGNLILIDGRYYVSVDDLARSLHGAVQYGNDQIVLSLRGSDLPRSPSVSPAVEDGEIKGTLTFFFNKNYGTRPDVGAQAWLITGPVDTPPDAYVFFGVGSVQISSKTYEAVKQTVADGNGNFRMDHVPPGNYTLILQSQHSRGALDLRTGELDKKNKRDVLGRVFSEPVEVHPGEAVDASHDFGTSTF